MKCLETDDNVESNIADNVNIPHGGESSSVLASDTDSKSQKLFNMVKITINDNDHVRFCFHFFSEPIRLF